MADIKIVSSDVLEAAQSEKRRRYREHRRTFGLSELEIDREVVFGDIIRRWNDEGRHYGGLVACGALGVAHIHWIHRWEVKWCQLEPLPEGIELP